jgi:hypothetical protein
MSVRDGGFGFKTTSPVKRPMAVDAVEPAPEARLGAREDV